MRCRGRGDKRRGAHQEPGREDRGAQREAQALQRDAGSAQRTGDDQISLTDPDSRAMAAHTKAGVGYNIQIAVDAKHKLIVEQAVTKVVDMGLLTQIAEPARQILDVRRSTSSPTAATSRSRTSRPARGRLHPARSQTATRLLGARGLLPQGRVRYDAGATPMFARRGRC
jgi:hypothetical protein